MTVSPPIVLLLPARGALVLFVEKRLLAALLLLEVQLWCNVTTDAIVLGQARQVSLLLNRDKGLKRTPYVIFECRNTGPWGCVVECVGCW